MFFINSNLIHKLQGDKRFLIVNPFLTTNNIVYPKDNINGFSYTSINSNDFENCLFRGIIKAKDELEKLKKEYYETTKTFIIVDLLMDFETYYITNGYKTKVENKLKELYDNSNNIFELESLSDNTNPIGNLIKDKDEFLKNVMQPSLTSICILQDKYLYARYLNNPNKIYTIDCTNPMVL